MSWDKQQQMSFLSQNMLFISHKPQILAVIIKLEHSDMLRALNMAKMAKGGFSRATIEETQYLIKKPQAKVQEQKKLGVEFPAHKDVNPMRKDTRLRFRKIEPIAAFPAILAQHRIPRHARGANAWVHLHRSNSDSRHQIRPHIRPGCRLCHLVWLRELMMPRSRVCHPDRCIYILLFPAFNFSILRHIPTIASTIKILIQICWLMKQHPLIITLSAVW